MRWYIHLVMVLSGASAVAGGAAISAADDYRRFAEYNHTAWTIADGAPGDIYAIAQTPDGWLWLAGPRGLFRFDGVQFERVEITGRDTSLSNAIYSLYAEDDGNLWIGYSRSGASVLRDGAFRHFDEKGEIINSNIAEFQRDQAGTLWAASYTGLLRFDGERWHRAGAEVGLPDLKPGTLHLDAQGTLWISDDNHIYFLRRGESKVQDSNLDVVESTGFLEAPDGRSWYEDPRGAHLLPGQIAGTRPQRANSREPIAALFDRDGHYWALSGGFLRRYEQRANDGPVLLDDNANTDRFTQKDGLSGPLHSMIEDREGNIWTASAGGIDRFRPNNIRKLPLEEQNSSAFALAPAQAGAIWVGRHYPRKPTSGGLWKFDGKLSRIAGNEIEDVSAAAVDGSGAVWLGGVQGIWRAGPGDIMHKLPDLPDPARGQIMEFLAVDAAGAPWVSVLRTNSAYRLSAGAWEPNGNLGNLPPGRPRSAGRDAQGNLWFGYDDHNVAVLRNDEVTLYGPAQGLEIGTPKAYSFGRWTAVAGTKQVAIFDGSRFHAVRALEDPTALEGVTGIAESADGDLWLNGFRGAVRIAHQDLENALRIGNYTLPLEVFDVEEGFPGIAQTARPFPSLIRATDGQLWFAGTLGVGSIHPERVHRNDLPPPVLVRSIMADKKLYTASAKVVLPTDTHDLQFNYTALSYSRPERMKFRYRLEGYDREWIDAGTRRQAFYTNLPPGEYRFHVVAANDSGIWNEAGTSLSMSIPAMFHQTRAFMALCVLAGVLALWGIYVLRVRQITARLRARLEERLDERSRIARDLHDTLLQGVQGLILQFQSVANKIDAPGEAQSAMTRALDRADALLVEGRDRVQDLRSTTLVPKGLRQALSEVADKTSGSYDATLRVIENGTPRELHPIVREEAGCIAIEAMLNALRHATAKTIEVELSYERTQLRVSVCDDGCGMDESMLRLGREGHFGLMGMRERASRIRANLSIWSRPSEGTEISLVVPASMAYVKTRRGWSWFAPRLQKRGA